MPTYDHHQFNGNGHSTMPITAMTSSKAVSYNDEQDKLKTGYLQLIQHWLYLYIDDCCIGIKDKTYNSLNDDDYDDDDSDSRSCEENEAEPKKPKRTRTAFNTHQLDQLELLFASTHYPDVFTREETAKRLSIKEDRIQVLKWRYNL